MNRKKKNSVLPFCDQTNHVNYVEVYCEVQSGQDKQLIQLSASASKNKKSLKEHLRTSVLNF